MKQVFIALTVFFIIVITACNQKQNDNKTAELTNKTESPIDGNWVTVSFEVNGKKTNPKRVPQQFKMFHDGYFSLIMYNDEGNFSFACAGTYELNDKTYKETCTYHSDTNYINARDWQTWETKGDTLIFYGFEKAEMPDGNDVTKEWNTGGKFIEKRVRVKK
jgi:hypothetical protein